MSSLSRELVFLILQFLDEEKFKDTVHRLEKESGFFFNMRYFEDCISAGEWDDVEKYLSGFTKADDNRYSMKIFFEIRKQKYLEALDKKDHAKAVEILAKELKVFSTFNEELFKEITMLLTLTNFRENEQLSKYGDTKSARGIMLGELKKLIEANPLFRDKLQFPTLKNSRLRTLINQSLNWQHQLCKNPRPNPDIKTLFVDHSCGHPNGSHVPSPVTNHLMGSVPKVGGFPPLGAHGPFQPTPAPLTTSLAGWMPNPSVSHPTVSAGPIGLGAPNSAVSMLKRPRTPPTNSLSMDYQTADSESVLKRPRPFGISDGVNNHPVNVLPVTYPGQNHAHAAYSTDDLPKTVSRVLSQGSAIKSMDFHPVQQTMLLVGTNLGDIAIWEVGSRDKLASRSFKVWDLATCTGNLQASLASEYTAAVNRVIWSPDGGLLGVAYSKHIVHIYSYHGGDDLRNHLEIDAHAGNVNDLAFSQPNQELCVVTCGEDKTIKVWSAVTGNKLHTFEGHEAPVYSVCPHQKENIQFIFSTAVDGRIKAWLYDNMGSRVDYDAPGRSCTAMAYSADGTRLFSCGTSKEGESFIVEWNESEGAVKRTYLGLGKRSVGVVQFDTLKNKFLVAGDEFHVKFWDMDSVELLTTTTADGGLPSSPCLRINKEGTLLAVSTTENGIKILANAEGSRILHSMANRGVESSRAPPGSVSKGPIVGTFGTPSSSTGMSLSMAERSGPGAAVTAMNGDTRSLSDVKPRIPDEAERSKVWKLAEISERSQLRTLRLPDTLLPGRIVKLIYTNSGGAILALAENALHKLWKWQKSERNLSGKANSNVPPQLWQPPNGVLMTNDTREGNKEDVVPCFALSKNDSYVMSASGGKISLFNMMTFKTMTTFMAPPLSSMQILPLEAPPTDGNLGPLPPSQLTDQEIEERELQSEQTRSNQAPESVATHTRTIGIIHPPPDIRSIVEKTAQFVSKNGLEFEKRIMASNAKNAKFNFLTSSDPYHAFYQHKLAEYRAQNEDGAQGNDADGADLQLDGGGDEGEAGEAKPDLQAQFRVPPKPLEPPEPEKYTVRLPEGITGEELEYIKLTAQFVARNGKSFLTGLQSRENNNPQFFFMKPTHSMFPLFTSLVDAYFDVLKPPEDLKEKLRKSAADLTTVLERCLHRLEWDRSQEQQRKKEEDEKEQERVQMAMIDWHDFVVVESIDFADEEDEELPPPMTLEEVIRRSKVSAAMEEDEVVEPGKEVEMEMDEEEMKLVADGMRAANLEENGGYVRIENMNEEAPMRIVKNWKRPEDRIPTERDPTKVVISPITGELIPINEMSEHMRISLIDPKFKEQKDRMFAKIRETTLAQDDEIAKNIVGLARLRPDIFGTTEEEVSNAVKAEIEKKKDEQPSQVIWDGHTGSIGRTANQALAQNANGEEQGNGVYGDPNSFPGPAALPPPRPGVPVVRPLPPPPNLALNLPRPPPSVQYPPRPLGVPMMQAMHPQHQLSMPGQPGHPSMMMMNRPPQMQPGGMHVPPPPGSQFAHLQVPRPYGQLAPPPIGMMQPPPMHGMPPPPPPGEAPPPLPEEPEPKRQKLDESALVPEEQFLAQHPGSATIRVSVPNVDDGQVIEITVQSLSENVGSLKEKIAGETQIPANKQKLSGKAGFLKDNMSLAHYNLGAGEILTLSLRERGGRKR